MSNFNTQSIAKTGFTKSKAYGLCGTLALATALVFGATVSADEVSQPVADTQPAVANVYTADNAGNVTVTPSETVAPVAPTTVETAPVAESPATTTEAAPAAPTTVTKEGDTINVENPNVEVNFPNGNGKYSPFEVEYKDINIPDNVSVNEGDKVVTQLPDQIGLQTSFDFDVYNGENVVGKANADAQERKITTTFNNYFTSHPLNKTMSLKFDARWTDVVTPGKPSTPEKAPKTSVERPNNKVAQSTTVSYKLGSEPKEVANTPVYGGTLPNTGEKEGIMSTLGLVVIAAGITALTLGFKKYNEGEEE